MAIYIDAEYWDALYIAEDFAYPCSWNAKAKEKPRVLAAKFGEGYEQRTQDGINANMQTWPLIFEARTDAEADAIVAFFRAYGGVTSFTWTNLDGVEIRVVCREWERTYINVDVHGVAATFEQVPA